MWLLVVVACVSAAPTHQCGSALSPSLYPTHERCQQAGRAYGDVMRMQAMQRGRQLIALDARCIIISEGEPS